MDTITPITETQARLSERTSVSPSRYCWKHDSRSNRRQCSDAPSPIVWSFFSGAMGLDLGMESAGWHPSLAVEMEPKFCNTIRLNRPDVRVIQSDVGDLTGAGLKELTGVDQVDVVIGGPPCQSFSTGGNRAGLNDPRGNAIFEYMRLIAEIQPHVFVFENVANLVTAAIRHRPIAERPGKSWNLSSYSATQDTLFDTHAAVPALEPDELSGSAIRYLLSTVIADLGYKVRFSILDSADYGAPQKRLRFVMIGARDGVPPEFIDPTHGSEGRPLATIAEAISDLVDSSGPGSLYTEETRGYFDLVPPGGNWRSLPPDIAAQAMGERSLRAGGGKTGFFRRLRWDGQSPTITGKPNRKGSAMCHPSVSRPLSVRECARLQGFPDEWQFNGSVADQYTQIGNAVPVALGTALGLTLQQPHASGEQPDVEQMLATATDRLRASARNTRTHKAKEPAAA